MCISSTLISATTGASVTSTTTSTRTYSVTNSVSGCTSAAQTVTVTVSPVPTSVTANSSSPSVCIGNTFNLTGSALGGNYISSVFSDGFETFPSINFAPDSGGTASSNLAASSYTAFPSAGSKAVNLFVSAISVTTNNSYTQKSNLNLSGADSASLTFNAAGFWRIAAKCFCHARFNPKEVNGRNYRYRRPCELHPL